MEPIKENEFQTLWSKAYLIFLLSSSFYLYEYVLQVSPSVMAKEMMQTFDVTARGFGIVSAFYFYAYSPMQLPAGLLYDRYGPRKVLTMATSFCALGALFFASTDSLYTAALGRFLIGMGSAFSFIGILVLISRWFPLRYFALLAGVAQLMSSVGAIFGEMPLAWLTHQVGWRNASFILAGAGLILALLQALFIKDSPHHAVQEVAKRSFKDEIERLKSVCRLSQTWWTGLYAGLIWTPIAVFAALWGVPFLEVKCNIGVVSASIMCSMIWVGIGVGSPLLGLLSDKIMKRRPALLLGGLFGLIATYCIVYLPLSSVWLYVCLFVFGLGAGGQTVSFAVVSDNNPSTHVGTASGFNNLSVLIGGAIFQPVVGIVLNHIGASEQVAGVPTYSVQAFQTALILLPLCYALSMLVVFFKLKESYITHHET